LDISDQMIGSASQHTPGAKFFASPAENIPLLNGCVDLAFSSLSFHHWTDQAKGLSEIARVLRPGGFFCLADQTMPRWFSDLAHSHSLSAQGIRAALRQTGFIELSRRFWLGSLISITLSQKPARD
jgi:ubiquinone/menaquinone biosynthesis C-methylase UbiE